MCVFTVQFIEQNKTFIARKQSPLPSTRWNPGSVMSQRNCSKYFHLDPDFPTDFQSSFNIQYITMSFLLSSVYLHAFLWRHSAEKDMPSHFAGHSYHGAVCHKNRAITGQDLKIFILGQLWFSEFTTPVLAHGKTHTATWRQETVNNLSVPENERGFMPSP